MRKRLLHILCLAALSAPVPAVSQGLPALKNASEITTGSLPDGITYYVVKNASTPGFADYALIQPFCPSGKTDRASLNSLPHFRDRKPFEFLSENGIGYNPYGYAYVSGRSVSDSGEKGTSVVYRFTDVPVFNQSVADSTLLMLFDIALSSEYRQSIVISGDVNAATLTDRMSVFSMMVPSRKPVEIRETHEFIPSTEMQVRTVVDNGAPFASVEAYYKSPRTKLKDRNTMQPTVTEMMALQLGDIIRGRLKYALAGKGVPNTGIDISYSGVGMSDGDEGLKIRISTVPHRMEDACECLASVLSGMDREGALTREIRNTAGIRMAKLKRDAGNTLITNAEYVNRCIASCLYGTALAPDTVIRDFYKDREFDEEIQKQLFNRYAAAVLDREKNLTLTFVVPDYNASESDKLVRSFKNSWDKGAVAGIDSSAPDTLSLVSPKKKTKIKVTTSEPLSGGEMWTFNNGMKVVFKKDSKLKGKFCYAFSVKGGISGIPELKAGESAFVNDMLPLYNVSGMSGSTFSEMLESNGIEMSGKISQSDLRFSGSAPSGRLSLLMKSLLSYSSQRKVDPEAFNAYRTGEELRIRMKRRSTEGLCEVLDSTMSPDYIYLDHKQMKHLSDNLPSRVDKYLDNQFSNCGNAILVLIGDLDKDSVQKQLCRFIGNLHSNSQRPVRPKSSFTLENWWLTRYVPSARSRFSGKDRSINVAVCAKMPFSTDNYFGFSLARIAIERELTKEMGPLGMTAVVRTRGDRDRLSLYVVCRPCMRDGLPSEIEPGRPQDVLNAIRKAVNRFSEKPLSDSELKICKDVLTNRTSALAADPAFVVNAVVTRNFEGMDVLTNHKTKISSVPLNQVNTILTTLGNGSKVEYIVI